MKSVNYHHTQLPGETGKLLRGITAQWLIGIRESNPAILDMFRDRDRRLYRDMLPWSGEFAGKYLTGAAYVYRMTGNRELYDYIQKFIEELLLLQDEDGYLGCYSKECRLTGAFSTAPAERFKNYDGILYRATRKPSVYATGIVRQALPAQAWEKCLLWTE